MHPVATPVPVTHSRRGLDPIIGAILMCGVILSTIGIGVGLGYSDIDVWGSFCMPGVLCLITIPFIRSIERRQGTGLVNIVTTALIAKMIGAYAYFLTTSFVYTVNDASGYHAAGVAIAEEFLAGERSFWSLLPRNYGTRFISELNGLVSLVSGRSMMASYMVFSWFGFLGLWGCVGAFRRALPGANLKRYAILTFFLPSALFWTSALGKEAWMLFGVGLFVSGVSRLLTSETLGLLLVALGGWATGVVRPHVSAILLVALLIGFVLRRGAGGSLFGPVLTLITVILIAAGTALASSQVAKLLPEGGKGLGAVLDATERQSSIGGSMIEVTSPNSPLEYPRAFFTVMFRPLPLEVQSVTQMFSALETTALLGLIFFYRRDVLTALKRLLTVPYLRFAGVYTAAFAFAWSSIGNLGIISRQRVQVLPLLLVFLCFRPAQDAPAHRPLSTMGAHRG